MVTPRGGIADAAGLSPAGRNLVHVQIVSGGQGDAAIREDAVFGNARGTLRPSFAPLISRHLPPIVKFIAIQDVSVSNG